jgi:hypothetical protein
MGKHFKGYFVLLLTFVILLSGAFLSGSGFAKGHISSMAPSSRTTSLHTHSTPANSIQVVDMRKIPAATASSSAYDSGLIPLLTRVSPAVYAQEKAAAAHDKNAPRATHLFASTATTPITTAKFKGMANSASICPYSGGCQPPDDALASSPNWVFQGVNTSFAVYSPTGVLQPGWPKNARKFFGVPSTQSCDSHGPFLLDPRAFYDINTGLFWTVMLQRNGPLGSCAPFSQMWIAHSQTSDPNGSWTIGTVPLFYTGSPCTADFPGFGFDGNAVYVSLNVLGPSPTCPSALVLAVDKSSLAVITNFTFTGVDTIQPVETLATGGNAPFGEFLISSGVQSPSECSGPCITVWSLTLSPPSLSFGASVGTTGFTLAPQADQPGCSACIETLDTRISASPIYTFNTSINQGLISFALETGVNNGTRVVPGVFWGQVSLSCAQCFPSIYQSGYLAFVGDQAASFGAMMPYGGTNLLIVFDSMSSTLNPSIMYTTSTTPPLLTNPLFLKKGLTPTNNTSWGEYSATSFDGTHLWLSGEYSGSNKDWSTFIGEI